MPLNKSTIISGALFSSCLELLNPSRDNQKCEIRTWAPGVRGVIRHTRWFAWVFSCTHTQTHTHPATCCPNPPRQLQTGVEWRLVWYVCLSLPRGRELPPEPPASKWKETRVAPFPPPPPAEDTFYARDYPRSTGRFGSTPSTTLSRPVERKTHQIMFNTF